MCVCDESGVSFLLDTGAAISCLPPTFLPSGKPVTPPDPLHAETATGCPMKIHGSTLLNFSLLGEKFSHRFQIADVQEPILGFDFLQLYGFSVHPVEPYLRRCEVPASPPVPGLPRKVARTTALLPNPHRSRVSPLSVPTPKCSRGSPLAPVPRVSRISAILNEFSDVFQPTYSGRSACHGVTHDIITEGQPVMSRARRLPPEKLEFEKMEAVVSSPGCGQARGRGTSLRGLPSPEQSYEERQVQLTFLAGLLT